MAKRASARGGGRGSSDGRPMPRTSGGELSVIVEMRHQPGNSGSFAMRMARDINDSATPFTLDERFEPVHMGLTSDGMSLPADTYVVRGTVADEAALDELRGRPEVAGAWLDTVIAPFAKRRASSRSATARVVARNAEPEPDLQMGEAMAGCPIPPCDCAPGTPKGTIADVAAYLGVPTLWSAGFRGAGMVVGVVDGGITASGRPVIPGETSRRIARVIGGWPTSNWGTQAAAWGEHGNMCATDVLGMAPEAQIYDLRISGSGGSPATISRALQAFDWAISQFRLNGTPHVLSNSWGIFQETWDATYARNPNHPFTRKVVEAINEGILVLFAAGNCGDTCPDNRCGPDNGPGRSIWGANGHPMVMTVGAVNKDEQFIGYSSRGPAALDPNKPDFCAISHFTGYFTSDSGTSAATPILAGAVALLKQALPSATQDQIKQALKATAKDIGPSGFDTHSGAGIVQIAAAHRHLTLPRPTAVVICRPTSPVTCARPTSPITCRPTLLNCPRPTSPIVCPRPTTVGCPRPTTLSCPRPTTLSCPRPTTVGCPRPTLSGCPRPTLVCGRPPRPGPGQSVGGPADPYGYGDPYGYDDPYGYGADWGTYDDPWGDPYADPAGWDPGGWSNDPSEGGGM